MQKEEFYDVLSNELKLFNKNFAKFVDILEEMKDPDDGALFIRLETYTRPPPF